MDDLIRREDFEEAIDVIEIAMRAMTGTITDTLKGIPSAAQDIVRCQDCKYYQTDKCYIHIERIWELKPDDYCSQGERDE